MSREEQRDIDREGKKRGETRGPGWRIVRSIVRLLYLVPSFCGSLSHPSLSPLSPSFSSLGAHLRVRRARSSRSCSYSCFLSSSLFPPPHRSPVSRLFLSLLPSVFSIFLPCAYTLSFSGLVSIVSHPAPPPSRCSHIVLAASAASLRAEKREREESIEREEEETRARTRVCVWLR